MNDPRAAGYSTPSERWTDSLRRLVTLQRIDGFGLARTIWWCALVFYLVQFLAGLFQIPGQVLVLQGVSPPQTAVYFLSLFLTGLLSPLLWLLLIRLALETCLRLLAFVESGSGTDNGSA